MQTTCPHCLSQQTSSYEMLWLSGTARGNTYGVGVTTTGEFGSFTGVNHQQSYLAQQVAQPLMLRFQFAIDAPRHRLLSGPEIKNSPRQKNQTAFACSLYFLIPTRCGF